MTILVGSKAPNFEAAAVLANGDIIDNFQLNKEIQGKYGLIFFYPLDFTFVCPSELIALDNRIEDFIKLNVQVIAISIDSQFTHNAWRNTPIDQGGIGKINYTLVSDITHQICKIYGIEHPLLGVALRGAFIIDKESTVRSQIVNDLPLGRNIDEILRTIEALQYHEKHGEVCPAGWKQGDFGITANQTGIAKYLKENAKSL